MPLRRSGLEVLGSAITILLYLERARSVQGSSTIGRRRLGGQLSNCCNVWKSSC